MAGLKFLDEDTRLMRGGLSNGAAVTWREEHGLGIPESLGPGPDPPAW